MMQGMEPPVGLSEEQRAAWLHDADFLAQLLDNNKVFSAAVLSHYNVCCRIARQNNFGTRR